MLNLSEIMKLDIMKPATIKTAIEHVGNKQVEWVSITEAPVENFIRKHELVLTTGIGYGHDPKQFYEFVSDVIKSEAAALAVATGRYIFELYEDAKALAEEHEFPILFLPWEIRFADLTQAVTARLLDQKQEHLRFTQHIQQELLSLTLAGNRLSTIADHVSNCIAVPIVITDHVGTLKGRSHLASHSFEKQIRNALNDVKAFDSSSEHHPLESKIQEIVVGENTLYVLPIIQTNHDIQGYLFTTPLSGSDKIDEQSFFIILEHTVTAAAFWFLQENAVQEAEARIRDNFVADLANGIHTKPLHAKARAFGYNLHLSYLAIVGFPHNFETLFSQIGQTATYEEWLTSMIHYIEEEIYFAGSTIERGCMSTFLDGQMVIFLEVSAEDYKATVNSFLDLLYRRLDHLLPDVELTWAIGDAAIEPNRFATRFTEAKQALQLGLGRLGKGSRIYFSDTKIDRVMHKIGTVGEIKELITGYVQPLIDYSTMREIDLLETFIVYQRNQNKVSQTARVLHLHRQSLLYRLRKIETITGLSLANPDNLFLLDLCIRTYQINKNMETPQL
ncbi:PucR family transcriptional regulator [Shouchella hunanensis]|uniref:PucR family transcriptional regulator ligand-binding domain-containing protein n=1 Tax=Shouchella hunanensis TaxID=766894 RepID=A0ABY7W9K4_9BACI|nr:PucR family transcriptional regulator [Shouchella hunanensis]WDF05331.1 PucR family transcriptional regulator ligand-binding domain-containing protein [Shouchella hunanensis]